MGSRTDLQTLLEGLDPDVNVYFQPPPNVQMAYPAIVYNHDYRVTQFADNKPYNGTYRYMITVIATDPDSDIPEKVALLPMSTFVRHYTTDKLYHNVLNLYF